MIDFHAHLDLYPDPQAVVAKCRELEMYVLSITTTPSAFPGTLALAADAPRIRTALGLHPQLAHQRYTELPLFERLLPTSRYVGEIGLDGAPEYKASWEKQLTVFQEILRYCAAAGGRVLSVHSRRAAAQVLDCLERFPGCGTPVLHWFSGSAAQLARAVEMGCWFSVGPAMLASKRGQQLAALMPPDKVVTESDGPFAQVGGRSAEPWDAGRATLILGDLWKMEPVGVDRLLMKNLHALVTERAEAPAHRLTKA